MSLPKISYGLCDNISCERIVKYFQYFQKNCTIPTMLGVRADALFEDYVGRQMVNRPSDPEFTVQFKTQLCPSSFMGGKMKLLEMQKIAFTQFSGRKLLINSICNMMDLNLRKFNHFDPLCTVQWTDCVKSRK